MKPEDVLIPPPVHPEVLYRYESRPREALNLALPVGNHLAPFAYITLTTFRVIGVTPCGYWIRMYGGTKKWVCRGSRRQYAHSSTTYALAAFAARKAAHAQHAKRRYDESVQALRTAQELNMNPAAIRVIKIGCDGWGE